MKQMIETMLQLQDAMNSKVNPNWRTAGYVWTDAIMVEAVEAFDHTSWKWWKNTSASADLAQIRLEVVDIWHFALSIHMEQYPDLVEAGDLLVKIVSASNAILSHLVIDDENRVAELQTVLRSVISESGEGLYTGIFSDLLYLGMCCDLPFEEVYTLYLAKNTLNLFRQDHGYKQGSYIKIWNGKEDNEVLTEMITGTDLPAVLTYENLYAALEKAYSEVSGAE